MPCGTCPTGFRPGRPFILASEGSGARASSSASVPSRAALSAVWQGASRGRRPSSSTRSASRRHGWAACRAASTGGAHFGLKTAYSGRCHGLATGRHHAFGCDAGPSRSPQGARTAADELVAAAVRLADDAYTGEFADWVAVLRQTRKVRLEIVNKL